MSKKPDAEALDGKCQKNNKKVGSGPEDKGLKLEVILEKCFKEMS